MRRLGAGVGLVVWCLATAEPAPAAAPVIVEPPRAQTVVEGSSHTFRVTVTGDEPLHYQWRVNGTDLDGRTDSTLPLTGIQFTDAGGYQVVVTNVAGAVTSAVAWLTVRSTNDPVYATPDGGWAYLYTGDAAANPGASALDGTWNHDNSADSWSGFGRGADSPPPGGVAAANGILTLEDAVVSGGSSIDDRRFYFTRNLKQDASVTNANTLLDAGVTLAFRARLTPATDPLLELTNAPNGWANANDGRGMFGLRQAAGAGGGMILSFSLNLAAEDLNTNSTFTFGQPGLHMNTLNGNVRSSQIDPGEGGTLNLLPLDPRTFHEFWITIQDNGADPGTHRVSVFVDGSLTPTIFNVTAGIGSDFSTTDPSSTNYLALGLPVTGQRGAVDVDFYAYKPGVIQPAGFNVPVGLAAQPASQTTLLPGDRATFSCTVTGTPPYAYQWFRDGAPLPEATNATYTTAPVTGADDGAQFVVVVTNAFSAATSSPPALLRLVVPPVITAQPASLTVTHGDSASFEVMATSGVPPTYQWRFNGTDLAGATNATYLLNSARPADAGDYLVVVGNTAGAVTSAVATLTVRTLDFGDAPAPHPTRRADDGARHVLVAGVHLGAAADYEIDGLPGGAADGDDTDGSDDEDGVVLQGPLKAGQSVPVEVVASTNGWLNAWIDFQANGTWADAGDQVFTNQPLVAGTNLLSLRAAPVAGLVSAFARFRFNTTGGLGFSGAAADGEVEDYAVTIVPVVDLSVQASGSPDPVATGAILTYTYTVRNGGPSTATGVGLTNLLPGAVNFLSAGSSQGSCAASAGTVTCALGSLPAGGTASVTVRGVPTASGLITDTVRVGAFEEELRPADNTASVSTTVSDPPGITAQPESLTRTNGGTAVFSVTASGTPPLHYQWRFEGAALAGETGTSLVLSNVQPSQAGSYTVLVSNQVGTALSAPATLTVLVPPALTTQPQSRTNNAGSTASFSVTATGTTPLFYQWSRDGDGLPAETNASLVLTNVQTAQAGTYRATVSNNAGTVTSAAAVLTVVALDFGDAPDPAYPTLEASNGARHRIAPGVHLGAQVDFEPDGRPGGTATGDDLDQVDDEDGVAFDAPLLVGQVVGVTVVASTNGLLNAWLDYNRNGSWGNAGEQIFTNVALFPGTNRLQVTVPAGVVTGSSVARFRFSTASGLGFVGEAPDGEVEDYAVAVGAAVDLAVSQSAAPGTAATGQSLTYSILVTNRGPSAASGVTLTNALGAGVSFVSASASQGGCAAQGATVTCALGTLPAQGSATASVVVRPGVAGTVTNRIDVSPAEAELAPADNASALTTLVLDPPVMVTQPQSQTATNGDTVTLSVGATGTDLRYQWRRDGGDLNGETRPTLILSNVQPLQAGDYTVRVTNLVGAVVSDPARLTVLVRVTITAQPQSLVVTQGNTAVFHVTASGTPPLTYQWLFGSTELGGETGDTLTLLNVQPAQAGAYTVRVSNGFSSATSAPATLTVRAPPQIVTQPQNRTAFARGQATLEVVAAGLNLRYQWYRDSAILVAGATNASLHFTNVQTTSAGSYRVAITNADGAVTSAPALLTVLEADFGDAPDPYPTRALFNGAYHLITPGISLGTRVDFEADGQPNASAAGDDLEGTADEDGVAFLAPLYLGQTSVVSVAASTAGFLDAWLDFDGNGFWYDLGENVFNRRPLVAGTNLLTFVVPATAPVANVFARFRFSTAGGLSYEGPAADGEVEDYRVSTVPASDVALARVDAPESVLVGSAFAYTLVVTNQGPSPTAAVVLTNALPGAVQFLSLTNSQGTCAHTNGLVTCALGPMAAGADAAVRLDVLAPRTGMLTNQVAVAAAGHDPVPANNAAIQLTAVFAASTTFANPTRVDLPDVSKAGIYPSTIAVSGVTATVYKVTVTLEGLTHTAPDDLDFLLVGPRGQTALILSDAGGGFDIDSVMLTLDDDAATKVPDSGQIRAQSYRASNYDGGDGDLFVAPAPPGPHDSNLAVFRGTDPNGLWSLFIMDDAGGDVGYLDHGWSLSFTTLDPVADVSVTVVDQPDPVVNGSNLTYIVTVANRGPSSATQVRLTNALPAGVQFLSATAPAGSCSQQQGVLTCQLGTLAAGGSATVTVLVNPQVGGRLTNTFGATADELDPYPTNNTAVAVTTVVYPVDLTVRPFADPTPAIVGSNLVYALLVTNQEPHGATSVTLTNLLPANIRFVSVGSSQGTCLAQGNLVTCQLGALAPEAGAWVTLVVVPLRPEPVTNVVTVTGSDIEAVPANNTLTHIIPAVNVGGPFPGAAALEIPDVGPATPYPGTLFVSGLTASVYRVTVTLSNLTHASPADLDVLLVGPSGQTVLLLSDAGAGAGVTNLALRFEDDAAPLPQSGPLGPGIFRPTDYDTASDAFPGPAPAGPYGTNLAVFRGTDPNGLWSLFVRDDQSPGHGSLGGWHLRIEAMTPIADVAIADLGHPEVVPPAATVTCQITVTNRGPADATGVRLTDAFSSNPVFVSVVSSQGACGREGDRIECDLGALPRGHSAWVTLVVTASGTLPITNLASVSALERDVHPENNSVQAITLVEIPPTITVPPQSRAITNGDAVTFSVEAAGSAPFGYQWQHDGTDLPGATNATLTLAALTRADRGTYAVRVTNRVGAVLSSGAVLRVLYPPVLAASFDQIIIVEDASAGPESFQVWDDETPADQLLVTFRSTAPSLLPPAGIELGGSGSNRTVTITPAPNQSGFAFLVLTVTDSDGMSASDVFEVNVLPVNDPPTLAGVPDQVADEDTVLVVQLTVGDVETPAGALVLTSRSSNPTLVPDEGLSLGGTGSNRTVTLRPVTNQVGTATITLTVSDPEGASATTSFRYTVLPVNDPPVLSAIPALTIDEDTASEAIAFAVDDIDSPVASVTVTASSSDPALVPPGNIVLEGSGSNRTARLTPAPNAAGTAVITLAADDGAPTNNTARRSFTLTVRPVNDPPGLSDLPDQSTDEDTPKTVAFSVADLDSDLDSLVLSATSSNEALVPTHRMVFGGRDTNRSLTITPADNQSGLAQITLTVQDPAGAASSRSFQLAVAAVNDPPAIAPLADQTTGENEPLTVPFAVGDVDTPADQITVTGSAADADLVPATHFVFSGSGTSRSVLITPATNRFGTTTITLTATDGQPINPSSSRTFALTVLPLNEPPNISSIANQATPEDTPLQVAFTVGDRESASSNLVVTAASSNPSLVAESGLALGGTTSDRTLILTPAPDQSGTATITLTIADEQGVTVQTSFQLTVDPVNDPPIFSGVSDQAMDEDASLVVPFGVRDPDTGTSSVLVTAASSNPALIPDTRLSLGGSGSNRVLTLLPWPNQSGSASITLTASDGQASNTTAIAVFTLTVNPLNDPPSLTAPADQSTPEDTARVIAFTVGDLETPAASLTLGAASSNPSLVSSAGLVFGGSGSNRTVTVLPLTNQSGTATLTLTVTDGQGGATSGHFVLTVEPVNDPPVLSHLANQAVNEDTPAGPLPVVVGDLESPAGNLTLSANSSDIVLVPETDITFGGSGSNRTVTITPAPHRTGRATITLHVRDGDGLAATETFELTVSPVNDPPTLSGLPDATMFGNTSLALPVAVSDLETPAGNLTLTASSSNPTLVPNAQIVFGGSGANRTVTLTPAHGEVGTATITVTVTDAAGATASDSFVLTVAPGQDPPFITSQPQSRTVTNGAVVTFSVTATGSSPLRYQWTFNGTNLAQATNTTLSLSNVQPAQAGRYAVIVTNLYGSTTSDDARLTILTGLQTPGLSGLTDQTTPEDTPITVPFGVSDPDTPPWRLTVTGSSSDPAVVPDSGITFEGAGTNRTVTLSPAPDASGTSLLTLTVSDGTNTSSQSFQLTVTAVNDPPTVDPPPDVGLVDGNATQSLDFSGITSGAADEDQALSVTITWSNPALISNARLSYSSPSTTASLSLKVNNGAGSSVGTLSVSDGQATTERRFVLYVRASANAAPTLSAIASLQTPEDTPTAPLAFTVGDATTPANLLTVTARSSDPRLVPTNNIVLGGSAANRTVTLVPLPNQSGSSVITLGVTDTSFGFSSTSFTLTVDPVNDAPTVSTIPDQTTSQGTPLGPLAFTVGDAETPAGALVVTASSSDPALVPVSGLQLGGSGSQRVLAITPATNRAGSATITLAVTDGTNSTRGSFLLTVTPVNHPPTIDAIPNQSTGAGTPTALIPLTVGDSETPAASLAVTGSSSNPALVPAGNISFGGSGSNRTVQLTPLAGQTGTARITVTVADAQANTASTSFLLTVTPANRPPTLDPLADVGLAEDAGPQALGLTGLGAGAGETNQMFAVTATSSHPGLIPHPTVDYLSPNPTGTLRFTPTPTSNGTAVITVTVNDGQALDHLVSHSFTVTVNAAPRLTPPADQATPEDTPLTVGFTVADAETPAASLAVTASSSNPNLVAPSGLVLGGSGTNRTLTITPRPDESGFSTLTLGVTDAYGISRSQQFVVVVQPVNDPPTLAPLSDLAIDEDSGPHTVPLAGLSAGPANENQPLTVTALSSDPALIPHPAVDYVSPGGTGTLRFAPATNATGSAILTVTVSDGHSVSNPTSRRFTVTVNNLNDPPLISALADAVTEEDIPVGPIAFTVGDPDSPAESLTVVAESSVPTLVSNANVVLGGSGSNRTVTIQPNLHAWSWDPVTITLRVSDPDGGSTATHFPLTVIFVNDPPTLSALPDQTILEDTLLGPEPFTAFDVDGQIFTLTSLSSDPTLVPPGGLTVSSGLGRTYFLTVAPASNQFGAVTISTVMTDEQMASVSNRFTLTVLPVNDAPTLDPIPDFTLAENAGEQTLTLTGIGAGAPNELQGLALAALSSDPTLIPPPTVQYSSPEHTGRLTFTPASNRVGRAEITVTVQDDGDTLHGGRNAMARTFRVSVGQPTDLMLSIARGDRQVTLVFATESGKSYTVEYAEAVSGGTWRALTTVPGTGTTVTVHDPTTAATQRFYRLRSP